MLDSDSELVAISSPCSPPQSHLLPLRRRRRCSSARPSRARLAVPVHPDFEFAEGSSTFLGWMEMQSLVLGDWGFLLLHSPSLLYLPALE